MTSCAKRSSGSSCEPFMTADQATRSHCDRLVWFEIFAIQNAILDGVQDCERCVTVKNSSPVTAYSTIEAVTVTNGGSGYQPIEPEVSIIHPNGTGVDIEIVTSTTGEITSFNVISGGNNYDPVIAQADATGIGNGDAAFDVVVNASGSIQVVDVIASGTGYSIGDVIPIVHPSGVNAHVEVATVGGGGEVLSTVVINGGSGYLPVHAQVEIVHPTGFGFEGVVNVDAGGAILGISILNGGTAYTPLYPTLDIDGSGQGAQFSFVIDDITGEILEVLVDNGGFGYSSTDTVTVLPAPTSTGVNATVELVVETPSGVCAIDWPAADPVAFYNVYTNQTTSEVISKQINFIKNYFECLGYEFRILPDPDTNSTLMWRICW